MGPVVGGVCVCVVYVCVYTPKPHSCRGLLKWGEEGLAKIFKIDLVFFCFVLF